MNHERDENMIGAFAIAVADMLTDNAGSIVPRREPPAAIAILGRSPGWTILQLSRDLGLSHAATVRLIDRLVSDGLVRRIRSTRDGRAVELFLTPGGEKLYDRMLSGRHDRLSELRSHLSESEMEALGAICAKMLTIVGSRQDRRSRICRFCDAAKCRTCPMDSLISDRKARDATLVPAAKAEQHGPERAMECASAGGVGHPTVNDRKITREGERSKCAAKHEFIDGAPS